MFNSILENASLNDFLKYFILIIVSLFFGFILAITYKYYRKQRGFNADMPITILILPVLIASISMLTRLIGLSEASNRTTLGFSIAGILAITRFRSNPRDAIDLTFIMVSIFISFIVGLGYLYLAIATFALVIIVLILIKITNFSLPSNKVMNLKITIPEDLNFDNLFNDILDEFCTSYNLKSVKTTDFGTLYEIAYVIVLKNPSTQKELIDKLRERNGNLTISLAVSRFNASVQ